MEQGLQFKREWASKKYELNQRQYWVRDRATNCKANPNADICLTSFNYDGFCSENRETKNIAREKLFLPKEKKIRKTII